MKLGLSLAGGGIKGAAHIGVLKAFEEKNIKIDYISGTSSGSIVSTLYACRIHTRRNTQNFQKILHTNKLRKPCKHTKTNIWANIQKKNNNTRTK